MSGPSGRRGTASIADAVQAQIAEHVVVAGIVDQRARRRAEQIADDQFERLAGAVGQQDLRGLRQ